jgi:LuxR family transcriptional regulator, maltose regulon positive regulatory protein
MDYLIEEVLKQQPAEIKDFLLQTALLEQLSGPLCDAVLDRRDSQSVLELLEKNNLFIFIVSLDAERKWYRYHHLFAGLLRQRLFLSKNKPALLPLHAKASAWFEENQMYPLAIDHLLQAQDYEQPVKGAGSGQVFGQKGISPKL